MTATVALNTAFISALSPHATAHSALDEKPLSVDLTLPLPPRVRAYIYTLVEGRSDGRRDMKATLRVPGQVVGEYGSFDFSDSRYVLLMAYSATLDVFVLWDASLHQRFKHGGNIQVRPDTVFTAAATGTARQLRRLKSGVNEIVLACRPSHLAETLVDRHANTGARP
ncbi:hypothetical protein [Microbacterium timonense]|uniref:hypothetical protein n=1 Tax=Microbacterium timonense TaxID=2086576 RepID=UPI003899079E